MTPTLCVLVLVTYLSDTVDAALLGENKLNRVFWHQCTLIHCTFRDATCFHL